ncbi:MAG: prepilin peptidase, partial [Acidimicrobiales bacterium]
PLGWCAGSLADWVAQRLGAKLPLHGELPCPRCATPSGQGVSALLYDAGCESCARRAYWRRPAVGALTAALFVALAVRFGTSPSLPAELVLTAGLVALALCDLDHMILPKRLVYPTAALVGVALICAAAAEGQWGRLGVAAACGAGSLAAFFALNFAAPALLGFGDVRLAGLIGLGVGWMGVGYVLLGFFSGAVLASVVGLGLVALRLGTMKTKLPFGVFLAAGAVLSVLVARPFLPLS